MDHSLIKAVIFCTAFCGVPGEASMASTLSDGFAVPEISDSSRENKVLQESADLLQESESLLRESEALLDNKDGKAVLETVADSGYVMSQSRRVPIEDIKVGEF